MIKFALNIDGAPYPPEKAHPLFQRDPFPGGHQYTCVISGQRLAKYFADVPMGRSVRVSEKDARSFLLSLGSKWNPGAEGAGSELEYFLNSVEEIDYDGERLKFSGVCSPVVRGEITKP